MIAIIFEYYAYFLFFLKNISEFAVFLCFRKCPNGSSRLLTMQYAVFALSIMISVGQSTMQTPGTTWPEAVK